MPGMFNVEDEDLWMPIETAPRDGTEIDVWVVEKFLLKTERNRGERVTNAFWDEERRPPDWGYERKGEKAWVFRDGVHQELIERALAGGERFVTHWMPLPKPPKGA